MQQKKFLLNVLIALFTASALIVYSLYSACSADDDFSTNYEFETNAASFMSEKNGTEF